MTRALSGFEFHVVDLAKGPAVLGIFSKIHYLNPQFFNLDEESTGSVVSLTHLFALPYFCPIKSALLNTPTHNDETTHRNREYIRR